MNKYMWHLSAHLTHTNKLRGICVASMPPHAYLFIQIPICVDAKSFASYLFSYILMLPMLPHSCQTNVCVCVACYPAVALVWHMFWQLFLHFASLWNLPFSLKQRNLRNKLLLHAI